MILFRGGRFLYLEIEKKNIIFSTNSCINFFFQLFILNGRISFTVLTKFKIFISITEFGENMFNCAFTSCFKNQTRDCYRQQISLIFVPY